MTVTLGLQKGLIGNESNEKEICLNVMQLSNNSVIEKVVCGSLWQNGAIYPPLYESRNPLETQSYLCKPFWNEMRIEEA